MPKNRLRLDFSLQTTEERLKFLESYLPTITFTPDEHETETLSDYILWGKNKNGLQEAKFTKLNATHYRTKRVVFNREDTLKKAPPHLVPIFKELFA